MTLSFGPKRPCFEGPRPSKIEVIWVPGDSICDLFGDGENMTFLRGDK